MSHKNISQNSVTWFTKLSWNEHIEQKCKRAKGILVQCRRVIGPYCGSYTLHSRLPHSCHVKLYWGFTPKTMKWIMELDIYCSGEAYPYLCGNDMDQWSKQTAKSCQTKKFPETGKYPHYRSSAIVSGRPTKHDYKYDPHRPLHRGRSGSRSTQTQVQL